MPGNLVAAATVCATANSGTLTLSGYVSSILKWQSSADGGTTWTDLANTANTYTYNNLAANTAYRAYVQNAVCPALYSNVVTITTVQPVTTASAGPVQNLCNVASTTMAANTPTSGTGKWSQVAGPSNASFTNPADPHTTVNTLIAGTYQFTWTISNGTCADSKDSVQITVYPPTLAGTLSGPATVCSTANNNTLNLAGNNGHIQHWEFSIDNGSSWTVIADTTHSYTYNNLKTTTLFRVLVQSGTCATAYSNIVLVTVLQPVTPSNAGASQVLCNSTAATLNGNIPSSGTGTWVQAGGPTTVSFANAQLPGTTVNGLIPGTYQFTWVVSNGACPSSTSTTSVTINPATFAGTLVSDNTVCIDANTGKLALSGFTGSIIRWEASIDSGANWTVIADTAATRVYNNLTTNTRYRVLVQSGVCTSLYSNSVTITVNPSSVPGKLSANARVCATGNMDTLHLGSHTGIINRWEFSTDNGGSWTAINNTTGTYVYKNLTSTTLYRVLVQSGICSAAYSATVMITVDPPTVAGTLAGNASVCSGSNNGRIILSGRTGSVLHWEISVDSGATWNIVTSTADTAIYNNLTTTTKYRALVQNGACATQYSNIVTIAVSQPVTVAKAGISQVLCSANTYTLLAGNASTSGSGKWSFVSGPSAVSFADISSPNTTVRGLQIGAYRLAWTISNNVCPNSADTIAIKVDTIQAGFKLSSIYDCGKTTYQFTDTTRSNFGIQSWKWTLNNSKDTIYKKDHSVVFTTEGLNDATLTVQSNSGCINTTEAKFQVIVYQFPKADINTVADVCRNQLFQASPVVDSKDSIAYRLWNLGNGLRSKDSVVTVQYMTDGNYTLKLTVATVNHCFDSVLKQIAVHPIPILTINHAPTICKGDSILLQAAGATGYIWTDQYSNIVCNGCNAPKVKPGNNSQYKVIGYSEYGCSQVKTTDVRVIQPLKMIAAKGDTLCAGESKRLFATGAASYTWYPEKGLNNVNLASPVASPLETTIYHVIGKDDFSCFTDTARVKVVVGHPTPIKIGKDTVIVAGSTYQLKVHAAREDIRKHRWSGHPGLSCVTCPNPQIRVSDDVSITCTAINAFGCPSTDTLHIKTFCPTTQLFVPNAFTPDGDGINDVLMIQGTGIKLIKSFRIFSRWGELVFERTNFQPGDAANAWDGKVRGKLATPDVFVYICEVICEKGIPSFFKGNITILK